MKLTHDAEDCADLEEEGFILNAVTFSNSSSISAPYCHHLSTLLFLPRALFIWGLK